MKKLLHKYPLQFSLFITLLSVFLFELFGTFNISSITNNSSEYNVIAMAADLAGYDWKATILKTHYYGYTSSLIFSLVFFVKAIASRPILMLHILLLLNIIINVSCVGILFFITLNIVNMYQSKTNYILVSLITIACSLFISNQVLTKNVTNENLFVLCYYVSIYIIMFGNRRQTFRNQVFNSLLLALICVLAYATNGRGIILIGIAILMYIVYKILHLKPFGNVWVFIGSFFLLFILSQVVKGYFIDYYFHVAEDVTTELKNANVGGIVDRAFQLLNFKGLRLYIKLIVGWGVYFIVSTYGWGIIAIASAVQCVWDKISKKRSISDAELSLAIIILLFLVGMSMLGICFYHDSFYAMSYDNTNALADGRVDKLIYGRYISTIKSIIIAFGLVNLIYRYNNEKKFIKITLIIICVFEILFYFEIVPLMIGKRYAAVDIPEFALFFGNFEENYKFGVIKDIGSFKLIFTFTWAFCLLTLYFYRHKNVKYLIVTILLLNMAIGMEFTVELANPRTQYYQELIRQDLVEYIKQNYGDNVLVVADKNAYLYQFFLPTFKVVPSEYMEEELLEQYDYILLVEYNEAILNKLNSYAIINPNIIIISSEKIEGELFSLKNITKIFMNI